MTEKEFLEKYDRNKYNKPSVTVDLILCAKEQGKREVLLIKRGQHPYKDYWALPGGFVQEQETVQQAAERELYEETSIANAEALLLGVYSMQGRDPRGWTIGIAYLAEVAKKAKGVAGDDAKAAAWFEVLLEEQEEGYTLICKNERHTLQAILTKGDASSDGYTLVQSDIAFDHAKMLIDAMCKIA